jgi:RNA polymerase subunit RPABC4/transcription elongation factor Spt4
MLILVIVLGTINAEPRKVAAQQKNICTPVGTWNWMGGLMVVIHPDGSQEGFLNSNRAYTGRWESLAGSTYRLTWRENGSVDTLRLSPDGKSMDGSNSSGTSIHVTCQAGLQPQPTGNVCTPAGTWNWMGGLTVVIHPDGSQEGLVNGNRSYTGRWESLGGGTYRLTWRENGSVDTLRLSPDGKSMDGSNSSGTSIHVSCQAGPQPQPTGNSGLSGVWMLYVCGSPVEMTLVQSGNKVTGTMAAFAMAANKATYPETRINGTFDGWVLTFERDASRGDGGQPYQRWRGVMVFGTDGKAMAGTFNQYRLGQEEGGWYAIRR